MSIDERINQTIDPLIREIVRLREELALWREVGEAAINYLEHQGVDKQAYQRLSTAIKATGYWKD